MSDAGGAAYVEDDASGLIQHLVSSAVIATEHWKVQLKEAT